MWTQSGLNGSNSNIPDSTGRAFTTSFSAQSGSSGAVLNQSSGMHYTLLYLDIFPIQMNEVNNVFSHRQVISRGFIISIIALTCQTCLGLMHQEIRQILVVFQMVSNKLKEACLMVDML